MPNYEVIARHNRDAHARRVAHAQREREFDRLDAEAGRLVKEGKTDAEIAQILGISVDEAWIFTVRKR